MNPFYIGLPVWLLCFFAGYGIREYATGKMSVEHIGITTLALRSNRLKFVTFSVGLLLVFLVLRFGLPLYLNLWFLLALTTFAFGSIYFEVRACRTILKLAPPKSARLLVASEVVGLLGLLCLLCAMAATVL